jgi:hypothetical protein
MIRMWGGARSYTLAPHRSIIRIRQHTDPLLRNAESHGAVLKTNNSVGIGGRHPDASVASGGPAFVVLHRQPFLSKSDSVSTARRAVAVIQRLRWNTSTGFDLITPPKSSNLTINSVIHQLIGRMR